jgi:hypothetical protein
VIPGRRPLPWSVPPGNDRDENAVEGAEEDEGGSGDGHAGRIGGQGSEGRERREEQDDAGRLDEEEVAIRQQAVDA